MINRAAFQITADRHAHHHRRLPLVARTPAHHRQLIANLVHRGPDVIEELNLNHRLQPARRHADRAADNIRFGERRIENARAAKLSLQVGSDFENAAFAFHLLEILFARTVRHVFAKHDDARIARHLRVQATIDQVDHRAGIAGQFGACLRCQTLSQSDRRRVSKRKASRFPAPAADSRAPDRQLQLLARSTSSLIFCSPS